MNLKDINAEDPVVVITGSTRGIGAAIAQRLSDVGARMVLNSKSSPEAGRQLAQRLPQAIYCQADVTDLSQCQHLVHAAQKKWGRLDILVNNMGLSRPISHEDWSGMTDVVFQELFQHNVLSAWHMVQAAKGALMASPQAAILNVSSIAGIYPLGSSIPYAIAKAALNHLTKILAKILAPNIRVNAIAPGFTLTEKMAAPEWQALKTDLVSKTALQRPCLPEDIAQTALGILSSRAMTGQIIVVDGGI